MPLHHGLDLPKAVHVMFSLSYAFHTCHVNSQHKTTTQHFKTTESQILAAISLDLLHALQLQISTYRIHQLTQLGGIQVQKCSS